MGGTYRAWNGKTYPWPPPDGWYRADDGRWWARGSGPNPPPFYQQSTSQRSPGSAVRKRPRPPGPPADEPAGDDTADATDRPASERTSRPEPARPAGASPPDRSTDSQPGSAPPDPGGRRAPRLLVVTAAVALAALTGGAIVGLLAAIDEDDGARIDTTDTSSSLAPATTPGPRPAGPEPDRGVSPTDTDGSGQTVESEGATTRPEPATPATTPATTSTADGPASEPRAADERTERVAHFRELVTADSLRSDPLSDQDIEDLAVALCVIASVEDTTGFATARAQIAIEQSGAGSLTAEQLSRTINAAVRAFCPAEAARLGL